MKASTLIIKVRTDVSLMTIIKWRLLGLHKTRFNSNIVPDSYEAKNGKLFRIETIQGETDVNS